jgi:hypothetical protein
LRYFKKLAAGRRHGQRRPQQVAGQDVVVRLLRADVPRGAQEEAPRLLRQLRRVLQEVLGEMEGEGGRDPEFRGVGVPTEHTCAPPLLTTSVFAPGFAPVDHVCKGKVQVRRYGKK